jgi:hypothetical protein
VAGAPQLERQADYLGLATAEIPLRIYSCYAHCSMPEL